MANQEISQKILNKKFKMAAFSGYDTTDVDSFFDSVIEYLKNNDKMVELYKDELAALKVELQKLKVANNNLEKEKKKLLEEIKTYQEEGYGNTWFKNRSQQNKKGE